jgi:hydroxypyruvate reductase
VKEIVMPNFAAYSQHVAEIVTAALDAADPALAVKRHMEVDGRSLTIGETIHSLDQGEIYIISVGKAAVTMGLAAAEILESHLTQAIFVAKKTDRDWAVEIETAAASYLTSAYQLFQAGHPVPDEASVQAGTAVLDLLQKTTEFDLVIFLISGGASALLAQPLLPLADWQSLTQALLASGCTIEELNTVRRQLDTVKGGGLARAAAPAVCASLILSDVIGNPLEAIGSGPTVITDESPADALAILERYGIQERLETAVWQTLNQKLTVNNDELPPAPVKNDHFIIADLRTSAQAALTKAAQLGFISQILTTQLEGEAREAGRFVAALAKDCNQGHCLILGGETTVTLQGQGLGGRNQEMALSAAIALAGWPNRVVFCLATDGEDGPTDAAGAVVTGETAVLAQQHQLNPQAYLQNNDSYHFFAALDTAVAGQPTHHLQIGATGTNVNDLAIILAYPAISAQKNGKILEHMSTN